jgi:hypothetical protein
VAFDGFTSSIAVGFTACEGHRAYRPQLSGLFAEVAARICC